MNFTLWKNAYIVGWVSETQLKRLVELNQLSVEQYKEITGLDYVA